jgi:hypothetical protein
MEKQDMMKQGGDGHKLTLSQIKSKTLQLWHMVA